MGAVKVVAVPPGPVCSCAATKAARSHGNRVRQADAHGPVESIIVIITFWLCFKPSTVRRGGMKTLKRGKKDATKIQHSGIVCKRQTMPTML